jgi:y4mF family transcriptional regulator
MQNNSNLSKLVAALANVHPAEVPYGIGSLFGKPLHLSAHQTLVKNTSDLGMMIRTSRKAQRLNQTQLAEAAGVGRRFVSEIEDGKATAEFGKLLAVCSALGIDLFARPRG